MIGLLIVHAGLLLYSLRRNFVTVDEPGHFAAGISHWDTGTFIMYRVNPPLPRMLAVLPVLLANPHRDYSELSDQPGVRVEWWVSKDFVAANQGRYFDLICLARLAGVGWSSLGGYLIYRWGRTLYGGLAGCFGLAIWCFGPNVLAHAQLLTPDMPATVGGLAATYAFWQYLRGPSWKRAFLAGVVLGLAELTKCTLVVLYVVWPVLWILYRWLGSRVARPESAKGVGDTKITPFEGQGVPPRLGAPPDRLGVPPGTFFQPVVAQMLLIFFLSVYVINVGYGFENTCQRLGHFRFVSRSFRGPTT